MVVNIDNLSCFPLFILCSVLELLVGAPLSPAEVASQSVYEIGRVYVFSGMVLRNVSMMAVLVLLCCSDARTKILKSDLMS